VAGGWSGTQKLVGLDEGQIEKEREGALETIVSGLTRRATVIRRDDRAEGEEARRCSAVSWWIMAETRPSRR